MGEFTVNCPQCRESLLVTSDLIGQNVSCPACNQIFMVNMPQAPQPEMMNPPFQQPPMPVPDTGSKMPKLNFIALGIAALALIVAGVSFFVGGEPEMKFSEDPEEAMIEYWKYLFSSVSKDSQGNAITYFSRKHGKEYCSNMEIIETQTNNNYVFMFCKTSVNGKEKHICGLFRKNIDGYWIPAKFDDAKKEISSSWCDEMNRRNSEFMRNYGIDFNEDL